MAVVSAFLVPGSPLPYVQRDNLPWGELAAAMEQAGASLAQSNPDTIVVYSAQWIAVLDQLWQTRPHVKGLHVDENWHEYGDLPYDITIDTLISNRPTHLLTIARAAAGSRIGNSLQAPGQVELQR